MKNFKNLLWGTVASVAFSSCSVFKGGTHNPAIVGAIAQPENNQFIRANSIANQETEHPKGFVVHNKDFVETKNYFSDADTTRKHPNDNMRTSIGFDLLHQDVYLLTKDKSQRVPPGERPTCDAQTAIFLSSVKNAPGNVQLLCLKAQAAADSSKKTNHMSAPIFREMTPNVVEVFEFLGGSYNRLLRVNFKENTVTHGACSFQSSINPIDSTDATVIMAKNFANQNNSSRSRFQALTKK